MDENLVGYLLKALDADTERQVEHYLRTTPGAQARLELLRQAVEPLEADREEMDFPAELRIRTLRLVAESRTGLLKRVAQAPPLPRAVPISWWRRADVLVAASLLLICMPLLLPLIASAHRAYKRINCENNLRGMFEALITYSDRHAGDLPKVEDTPPGNFAGVYAPVLYRDGLLNETSLRCPASSGPPPQPMSLEDLTRLRDRNPQQFEKITHEIGGGYAYALGYRDEGKLCGLRVVAGQSDTIPIMADRPPFDRSDDPGILQANSQNHGGLGQNVLFLGGNVKWAVHRRVGPNDKDIYLNANQELKAGLNRFDTVLAASGVKPEEEPAPDH
ncbi:MAG TPA: hypothetical protein VGY66_33990 [Gemmataceae bacterium]|jgi:hypothetical protein|nr:hypothetical protein [Gemmataceae bacterium]